MKPVQTQVLVAHKCQCRWDSASNLRANARSHSKKRRSEAEDWFTVQICETSTFRRAHLAIAVTLKLELCTFTFCLGVIFKRFRDFLDGENTFRETSCFGHLKDVVYENKRKAFQFGLKAKHLKRFSCLLPQSHFQIFYDTKPPWGEETTCTTRARKNRNRELRFRFWRRARTRARAYLTW